MRLRTRATLGLLIVALVAGCVSAPAPRPAATAFELPRPSGDLANAASATPGPASIPPVAAESPAATPTTTAYPPGTAGSGDDGGGPDRPEPSSPAPTPAASLAPVPVSRLLARLEKARSEWDLPGVSAAILWDDGRVWQGAVGSADIAAHRAMTTDTAFALASISKTFTAAVVLQLVEEGRLSLSEPVASLLPTLRLDRRITVHMLLDHTSGLPDYLLAPGMDDALTKAKTATWTFERAWSYLPKERAVPGRTWSYSNTNYLLLGRLVTAVTGRPLSVEIRERLLDPLRLTSAWYQGVELGRGRATVGYELVPQAKGRPRPVAVGPPGDLMPFRSVVTAAGGAGSIAATALDAARWMHAFVAGDVLDAATRRAMIADASVTADKKARVPYGLGVQVVHLTGRTAIGHSGRYIGFRNVVRYLPDIGLTIAVLTNQSEIDPARVAYALVSVLVPPLPTPEPLPTPAP